MMPVSDFTEPPKLLVKPRLPLGPNTFSQGVLNLVSLVRNEMYLDSRPRQWIHILVFKIMLRPPLGVRLDILIESHELSIIIYF